MRVVVDDRLRVLLGASGMVIRFADDDGVVEKAPVAELAGSGRLRCCRGGRPVAMPGNRVPGLAGSQIRGRAAGWWRTGSLGPQARSQLIGLQVAEFFEGG
jgi:hypothetical protein